MALVATLKPALRISVDSRALVTNRRAVVITIVLYVVAALGSAVLLFSAETFFAKMLLPVLGGSPSVWTASIFFYELLVLAAYGYVHWSTR